MHMPVVLKICLISALLLFAAGCTNKHLMTADNFYRAIYDMSTQEQALKEGYPSGGPGLDIPSYEEYRSGLQENRL